MKTSIHADRPKKFRSRKRKRKSKNHPNEVVQRDRQIGPKCKVNKKGVLKTFFTNTNATCLENLRGKFKEATLQ